MLLYRVSSDECVCFGTETGTGSGTQQPAVPGAVCDVANRQREGESKISGMFFLCSPQNRNGNGKWGNLVTHIKRAVKIDKYCGKNVRQSIVREWKNGFREYFGKLNDECPNRFVSQLGTSCMTRTCLSAPVRCCPENNLEYSHYFWFFFSYFFSVFASCTNCKMRSSAARNN